MVTVLVLAFCTGEETRVPFCLRCVSVRITLLHTHFDDEAAVYNSSPENGETGDKAMDIGKLHRCLSLCFLFFFPMKLSLFVWPTLLGFSLVYFDDDDDANRPLTRAGSPSHTNEGATTLKRVNTSDAFCNKAKSSANARWGTKLPGRLRNGSKAREKS